MTRWATIILVLLLEAYKHLHTTIQQLPRNKPLANTPRETLPQTTHRGHSTGATLQVAGGSNLNPNDVEASITEEPGAWKSGTSRGGCPYGIMVSNPLPRIEHTESKDTLTSKHTEDTRHAAGAYSLTPLLGVGG